MQLLESQNLYPDCLSMALAAVPIQPNLAKAQQFDLYLTLQFSQQWYSLLNGKIRLGLKGGQLQLQLHNLQLHSLNPQLEEYFESIDYTSETESNWQFTLKTSQSIFNSSWSEVKLGTLEVIGQSYGLTANFTVFPANLALTEAEDLWRHDISPNKHGVLERAIVFFLLENQLNSVFSRVKLGSSQLVTEASLGQAAEPETIPQGEEQLTELIQRIYTAKTDNIAELSQIAQLNLTTDFAGANLLATNLSGIEFNGANLKGANLRGADLTDADLSEANLSYANLSGADLSGAYLDNTDLTYADLHRASLAVTNLMGADLSNANLVEANLSKTNLSRVKLKNTKFGDNPGISEEFKANLLQNDK